LLQCSNPGECRTREIPLAKAPQLHPADILGLGRLAADATLGVTEIVETVHRRTAYPSGGRDPAFGTGIAGIVYGSVRTITQVVQGSLTAAMPFVPTGSERGSSPEREAILAALNGVLGEYLVRTNNPLAIRMSLRRDGGSLTITREGLAATLEKPTGKLLLLVHGLCLNDLQWRRNGHDHGTALARDLGYTPMYLHYNSGLHVSENGRQLAVLLEDLLQMWPVAVEELAIIGHSMGGLISRSACQRGVESGQLWPRYLRRIVFLGTPHHGAPLERIGNWANSLLEISPYSSPFARLGKIRSAGVTDMRHGTVLEQDWKGRDRFASMKDVRSALPLPTGVRCYAVAATRRRTIGDSSLDMLGDGLVPVESALGRHVNPAMMLGFRESDQSIFANLNHWGLLSSGKVYERIRDWLA
jgi:pimeloyl-ACP methyl ester carboxylesterase